MSEEYNPFLDPEESPVREKTAEDGFTHVVANAVPNGSREESLNGKLSSGDNAKDLHADRVC